MVGILAEKPSAARNFAKALGGNSGTFKGTRYKIVAAAGHLYEFLQPHEMVSKDKEETYKNWDINNLPWNEKDIDWQYCVRGESEYRSAKNEKVKSATKSSMDYAKSTLKNIKEELSDCEEICIATDVDPTGEGQLLAWEIIDGLGLQKKKITRMYHQDEAPASVQKAFQARKTLPRMKDDPEYKKALMRSQWDLLSMQWTRLATGCVNGAAMLRQGRLKSAMVSITGDGLKALSEYKKIPFYQNRFRDENGNMFTKEDEPKCASPSEVQKIYHASDVVVDKTERKSTPPPRLIDLAKLAAMLAPKGVRSKDVLDVYQKMYEDQVVSYPRTEDKYITAEQFQEMLPVVDDIADLVGIDGGLLTHRTPRKTHIKSGCAHGANRPGVNVPKSINELSKYGKCAPMIYEILAKNFLAMFGEDYEYDSQVGHLKDYPDFIGKATIPQKLGWKQIFQMDDEQEDEENKVGKGLGKKAEPFVYEGFPPKPPTPTTKWLMAQLEKHDVGTGATRTSIYADVTNESTKYPLLIETKGKLSMSQYGEESYILLAGTHIGSVQVTEQLMSDMREVAEGSKEANSVLHEVQRLVTEDRDIMLKNKANLSADAFQKAGGVPIGKCPKCGKDIVEGTKGFGCVGWKDQSNPCKFTIWKTNGLLEPSKKRITADMAKQLLETGQCSVKGLVSKSGNKFNGTFKLKEDGSLDFEFAERESIGKCPRCGRDIVEGKMGFGCVGYRDEAKPCKFTIWKNNALLEKSKKSVTAAMAKKLLTEGRCEVKGLISKSGNKYDAFLVLQDDGEQVSLNMEFPERERNVVGTCPRCGRDVVEGKMGFGCVGYKEEKNPCKFTIWKNNALLEKSGKEVTEAMARDLLADGSCKVKGLKSSSGSTYNATLKLNDDGERVSLDMELEGFEATVVGKCPRCGRDVMSGVKGFGCVGYKDESNKCTFFLNSAPPILAASGKSLSDTQAKKLLNGDTIQIKGLTSKSGKKYDANFTMEDDGTYANLKMSFDETPKPKSASSRGRGRSGSSRSRR